MKRHTRKKPRLFSLLAATIAISGPLFQHLLLVAVGKVRLPVPFPGMPLGQWLKMYRRNRHVTSGVATALRCKSEERLLGAFGAPATDADLIEFPPSRSDLEELSRKVAGAVSIPNVYSGPGMAQLQFLVRVGLPCFILYREAAGKLLRRARQGDLDAFEALLRLDKSIVADPVLRQVWHAAMNSAKPSVRQRFLKAMSGQPNQRLDPKAMRIALAGLISKLATREGTSVTAQEIRDLFVWVEGHGLGDEEMPGGEALTKAVQRNRNWPVRPVRKKAKPGH